MAKIRNVSGEDRWVPWLGFGGLEVKSDEIVEVPDDQFESYICQPDNWADATPARRKKGDD